MTNWTLQNKGDIEAYLLIMNIIDIILKKRGVAAEELEVQISIEQ